MAKKLKWNLILMSVLYLGLGIFLLMRPSTALNVVCYALGGVVLLGAVIQLVRYEEPPVQVEDEKLMFRIIRASFNQRRKTLANGLKNSGELTLSKEVIEESITELGVPVTIRGEALSLAQFAELSNIILKKM